MSLFGQPGLAQRDAGLFKGILAGSPIAHDEPLDPDKMLEQKLLAQRKVRVKEFVVHTFDLSKKTDTTEYKKAYKKMYIGVQNGTISVQTFDKQFVPSIPGWLVHMEWVEYDVDKQTILDKKEVIK